MSGFDKFGKLLKYDLLENLYSILVVNGILLVLMTVFRFLIGSDNTIVNVIFGLIIPLGLLLSFVFLTIIVIRLLYNRIFTSDGYLTFALPVSLDAILLSKILISTLYIVVTSFVMLVWVALLSKSFSYILEATNLKALIWIVHGILGVASVNMLILLILTILHIGIITRFKILCGIVLFMLFSILESIGYGIIFGGLKETYAIEVLLACGIVFNIFKIAIYYFLTRYLISNKLEI